MTEPGSENPRHWEPRRVSDLTSNAYARLLAMTLEENYTARVMARDDAYADFFLESPSTQFHEYVGPPDRAVEALVVRASRMAVVDRLAAGGTKYPDFFVDSPHNGPPFHEKFLDKGPPKTLAEFEEFSDELFTSPRARVQALRQLRVMEAFLRMQESRGE